MSVNPQGNPLGGIGIELLNDAARVRPIVSEPIYNGANSGQTIYVLGKTHPDRAFVVHAVEYELSFNTAGTNIATFSLGHYDRSIAIPAVSASSIITALTGGTIGAGNFGGAFAAAEALYTKQLIYSGAAGTIRFNTASALYNLYAAQFFGKPVVPKDSSFVLTVGLHGTNLGTRKFTIWGHDVPTY